MAMKINKTMMPSVSEITKTSEKSTQDDFKFTLLGKVEESELKEKLNSMIKDITEQGDKLAKHMDIRDMKKYRESVKAFMNEIVANSHKFSRENFLDRRGRHRVYGIVKLVDKNLDELAQELISDEKNQLNILNRIDEIRGLLLDMVV